MELYERRPFPGERFGGSHQVLAAYGEPPHGSDLLELFGLSVDALEGRWLREARFLFADGGHRTLSSHLPFARLLRRGSEEGCLDRALCDRAAALGVRVHGGRRLAPEEADVEATGPRRVDGMAYESVFDTDSADRADVLVDPRRFGGGYAYLFVHQGRATLGVAVLRDFPRLEGWWEEARARFDSLDPFSVSGERVAKHHMNFGVPAGASVDGRLRVGEAAGFQDFLFGLGLRQCLLTGRLAARSLLTGESYAAQWQSSLLGRMEASAVDRWAYEKGLVGTWLQRGPVGDLRVALDRIHRGHAWRWPLVPWVTRPAAAREARS